MTELNTRKNIDSLAKASKTLMIKEPFYGLLLMSLNKVWSDKLPTAGVRLKGINYELAINPTFWQDLTPEKQMGVLKHELLHIAYFHLVSFTHLSKQNHEVANIAMDLEINQYIDRDHLPEDCCFLDKFPTLNLEPKKGTKYYFDKLMKNAKIIQCICDGDGDGSGSGKIQLPGGQEMNKPSHDFGNNDELSESEAKLVEAQTKHIVNQVAEQVTKMKGALPGNIKEILDKINKLDPPKFDWKGYIRRFTGKAIKTYTKKSRRKYNKRLPDNPGLKIKRQKHILAAVDTSGSVSTGELKEFLMELHHLKKTGSDVTLIQCDTAISHIGKFDPKKELHIHGRGGTEFQPVIDHFNEHQREYSCLIYFTDGGCQSPENVRGHVLWVLSSNGSEWEPLPGKVIQLD